MKPLLSVAMMFLAVAVSRGAPSVTPWVPIFQGIDQASGTNEASYAGSLSVNALRVDLQNPGIRMNITPPASNYVPDQRETLLQTPREFATEYGLQVAINAGYFSPGGYGNPSGTPAWLRNATISNGRLVSAQTLSNDSLSTLLFTTNNQPIYLPINWPATNTAGIYNAIGGLYPLLSNGVNISYRYTNSAAMQDTLHQPQPRTAFGLSQDSRYLIMMTIDGRQEISQGAVDYEIADFLLLFGAWNGMNGDGGGSTCMVKANECGVPIDVNHNSYQVTVNLPGTQRPIGCNLGFWALPLPSPLKNLTVLPGSSTTTITWETDEEATTQVFYGLTPVYGNSTPLDNTPRKFHVATLAGLAAGATYYYQAFSSTGPDQYSRGCSFTTTNAVTRELGFPMTNSWKYSTNNLDGVDWKAVGYDDSGWAGPSNALLHIENSLQPTFAPRNTQLPPGFVVPIFRTYYFRTPFQYSGETVGGSLTFSNYIDDGAVFYVNGGQVARIRMPAPPTTYTSFASAAPCAGTFFSGDADVGCPDVFTVPMTNVLQGLNMVAVEVHNISGGTSSQDILFGSALFINRPFTAPPRLFINSEGGQSTLYWNGEGFTLQQASEFTATNNWSDATGPAMQSPYRTSNNGTLFFRLRPGP